jgi:hypothetical protein
MYDPLQIVRRINTRGKAEKLERISKVPPRMASQKPEIRQKTCTMKPVQRLNGKRRRRERGELKGRPRKPKQVGSVGCLGESDASFSHGCHYN